MSGGIVKVFDLGARVVLGEGLLGRGDEPDLAPTDGLAILRQAVEIEDQVWSENLDVCRSGRRCLQVATDSKVFAGLMGGASGGSLRELAGPRQTRS